MRRMCVLRGRRRRRRPVSANACALGRRPQYEGLTSLHWAVITGSYEAAEFLVNTAGANKTVAALVCVSARCAGPWHASWARAQSGEQPADFIEKVRPENQGAFRALLLCVDARRSAGVCTYKQSARVTRRVTCVRRRRADPTGAAPAPRARADGIVWYIRRERASPPPASGTCTSIRARQGAGRNLCSIFRTPRPP